MCMFRLSLFSPHAFVKEKNKGGQFALASVLYGCIDVKWFREKIVFNCCEWSDSTAVVSCLHSWGAFEVQCAVVPSCARQNWTRMFVRSAVLAAHRYDSE